MKPTAMSVPNVVRPCAMIFAGTHSPCQNGWLTMQKSACCYRLQERIADSLWRMAGKNGSEELMADGSWLGWAQDFHIS